MENTINLVERADCPATWFITHDTPLIERLRSNSKFELGIHPNFNFLFNGDHHNGKNPEEIIDRLLKIVPEAKSIRTHSLFQSSPLFGLFKKKGLTFDSSIFIPENSGIELKPYVDVSGIIRVPYFWADYSACKGIIEKNPINLKYKKGIKVLDFHPIHIFLNTNCLNHYEQARPHFNQPQELLRFRNNSEGARTQLEKLIGIE